MDMITSIRRDALLRNGYFPKELPPTFHTRDFADYIQKFGSLKLSGSGGQAPVSIPATHNLARPGQLRRALKIYNPFNQYELSDLIATGWQDIQKHLDRSTLSVSRPVEDTKNRRAFVTQSVGNDLPSIRADRRAVGRHLITTDIARFYHTVYTHSIPWALHGKTNAKRNRSGGLGNELDRALRNGQDGQTLGIAVGPDTSLIIAEIIATSVDLKIQTLLTEGRGFRFIDDFELTLSSRSSAESTLAKVEEALADFELAINPLKTRIQPLPQPLEREWTATIREYELSSKEEVSKKDLLRYFNMAFQLSMQRPGEPVISYAVGRLRGTKVQEAAWNDYENLLFQCAVAEPASLATVLGQLHRRPFCGAWDRLADVVNEIVCVHSTLNHASEVAWAIWAAIWFRVDLSKEAATAVVSLDDPFVSLLALHGREIGILHFDLKGLWDERICASENLYNRNWLLMYEAHLRGWVSRKGRTEVENDPNFGPLLSSGVSFYDITPDAPVAYLVDVTGYGDLEDVSDERDSDL